MKKGDKVTSSYVEGVFTFKGIDKTTGLAMIKGNDQIIIKVPENTLKKIS